MGLLLILLIIIILNAISIALMYNFLGDLDKKEKLIFIAGGVAIMYVLTILAYWISTGEIEENYTSNTVRDLIVFLFVPINGLIILPILSKSYYSYRKKHLKFDILLKRAGVLGIGVLIAIILECIFFNDLHYTIYDLVNETSTNRTYESTEINDVNTNINTINDEIDDENTISNETVNNVTNEISNNIEEENKDTDNSISENNVNEQESENNDLEE